MQCSRRQKLISHAYLEYKCQICKYFCSNIHNYYETVTEKTNVLNMSSETHFLVDYFELVLKPLTRSYIIELQYVLLIHANIANGIPRALYWE